MASKKEQTDKTGLDERTNTRRYFVRLFKDGKVAQTKEYTTAKAAINAYSRCRGQLGRRKYYDKDRRVEVVIKYKGEQRVFSSWESEACADRKFETSEGKVA